MYKLGLDRPYLHSSLKGWNCYRQLDVRVEQRNILTRPVLYAFLLQGSQYDLR